VVSSHMPSFTRTYLETPKPDPVRRQALLERCLELDWWELALYAFPIPQGGMSFLTIWVFDFSVSSKGINVAIAALDHGINRLEKGLKALGFNL